MSDITKCTNEQCSRKESCKRWLVFPHEHWQSYCEFKPMVDMPNNFICEYFLPTLNNENGKTNIL